MGGVSMCVQVGRVVCAHVQAYVRCAGRLCLCKYEGIIQAGGVQAFGGCARIHVPWKCVHGAGGMCVWQGRVVSPHRCPPGLGC